MIRLILDASAVAAYGNTLDVGETINEVAGNRATFTIPAASLATAALYRVDGHTVDAAIIDLLLKHPAYQAWSPPETQWRTLAATYAMLNRYDLTEAVTAALVLDCDILTAAPGWYASFGDDAPIIAI